jgi:hypothetical protein
MFFPEGFDGVGLKTTGERFGIIVKLRQGEAKS